MVCTPSIRAMRNRRRTGVYQRGFDMGFIKKDSRRSLVFFYIGLYTGVMIPPSGSSSSSSEARRNNSTKTRAPIG